MTRLLISLCFAFALMALPAFASTKDEKGKSEHVLGAAPSEEAAGSGKSEGIITLPSGPNSVFYVALDPLVIPVVGERGITEIVSLIVKLEVEDQRMVERVNGVSPKLNDAYVRALYGKIDRSVYRNGRFLDIGKLKDKLTKVTDVMLGKGIVKDVLIQGVNQRQYN